MRKATLRAVADFPPNYFLETSNPGRSSTFLSRRAALVAAV